MGFGINVGDSSLQFVEISRSQNSSQVIQALDFTLPDDDEQKFSDETATRLRTFLQEKNLRIHNAVVGISGKEINIRYLKVMTSSAVRILQIVEMEIAQIHEKIGIDLAYQYHPLSKINQQSPSTMVAIAIVHNSFLERLHHFFKQSGISIVGFVPNSFSLYTVYSQLASLWDREMIYLAHISPKTLDIAICYEANLYFLRNLTIGVGTVSDTSDLNDDNENADNKPSAPEVMNVTSTANPTGHLHRIPDQLEASLKYAKAQLATPNLNIARVVISGPQALNSNIRELIAEGLHCPISLLEFGDLPTQFDPNTVPLWPHNYIYALGTAYLALLYPDIPLRIQSRFQQQREQWLYRRVFEYVGVAIAVLLAIIATVIILQKESTYEKQVINAEEHYQKLNTMAEQIKVYTEQNKQLACKAHTLQSLVMYNLETSDILSWLQQNLPEQVYLTQITIQQRSEQSTELILKMKGVVEESALDVYTVLKNFKQKLASNPRLKIRSEKDPRPMEDGQLEFEIVFNIGEAKKSE